MINPIKPDIGLWISS